VIKPKPFESLNHFTTPWVRITALAERIVVRPTAGN
jgi:hypothetical protein